MSVVKKVALKVVWSEFVMVAMMVGLMVVMSVGVRVAWLVVEKAA